MIQIKDLVKQYGDAMIFDHAEYTFPENGLICLLGASGSGKSTLLNLLAGFDSDYSGTVTVGGVDLKELSEDELCAYRRDQVGFVFQDYHLLSGYTVLENVLLGSELRGLSMQAGLAKAKALLERVGLKEKQDQKIENLSGGQKQRAAITRALMGEATVILADEPTGALDRGNSTEIMALLKKIAQEKLVIVVTHDQKICSFADEVIAVEDGQIVCKEKRGDMPYGGRTITLKPAGKASVLRRGFKNFRVHFLRYLTVGLAISIGIFCFVLSLSFGNTMGQSIDQFKEKNTAFNCGYVKVENGDTGKIVDLLKADSRIKTVYEQYKLSDVTLKFDGRAETMAEKYPMPKAAESMSYGQMPKTGQNEIALSPSLAKKFMNNINELIGKQTVLMLDGKEYSLTVSGIFNAGYDDFYVSSDLERELYQGTKESCYAVSYEVENFEDVVPVSKELSANGIVSKDAAKEAEALQSTFQTISRLFLTVSALILLIGLFISAVLLIKLQNSRYREIGLLSALGFSRRYIRRMIACENLLLAAMAGVLNAVWIGAGIAASILWNFSFGFSAPQLILSTLAVFAVIIGISQAASYRLLHTQPAEALRM